MLGIIHRLGFVGLIVVLTGVGCSRWQGYTISEAPAAPPDAQTTDPMALEGGLLVDQPPVSVRQPVDEPRSRVTLTSVNPANKPEAYIVKRGDTLWSIARGIYGDGQMWKQIVTVNPGLDPAKLRAGQRITLP